MSKTVSIIIPVDKVRGWQRAGKSGKRHYTQPETEAAQTVIYCKWIAEHGRKYTDYRGAFGITIYAFERLPKSCPKSREGEEWLSGADCDNIAKLVLDALNGIAYHDDRQCVSLRIEKQPRFKETEPRLEIEIVYYGIEK